jgi:hypothetical protein
LNRRIQFPVCLFLFLAVTLRAETIAGKVVEAKGNAAAITVESDVMPAVGDAVTIFFQLPGGDDEVLVGTGKVTSVTGELVNVAVDDLKGTLQKDQLARIDSKNPQPKSSATPAAMKEESSVSPNRAPVYTPPPYTPKLGVAASYNCDEGAGDTLTDNSNNGRPLKLYGGLGFTAGKQGRALDFKNSARLFARREKDDTILNFADRDFTIELAGNFRGFSREQVLLEKFSGKAGPGWTLTLLNQTKLHFFTQGAGSFTAKVDLKPRQWYRFVVARRGSRLQMSVDDAVVLDEPMAGSLVASPNPLLLGRRNEKDGRGFPVDGMIDDVRIDVVPPRRE